MKDHKSGFNDFTATIRVSGPSRVVLLAFATISLTACIYINAVLFAVSFISRYDTGTLISIPVGTCML